MGNKQIKAAILDLYNNEANEGIRCIKEILAESGLQYDHFDTRYRGEIPGTDYDIFISSGGPGDPFDGRDKKWEKDYFNLLDRINRINSSAGDTKKFVFFICHSFQLMARYYGFGEVTKRPIKSFGLIPFKLTQEGKADKLFNNMPDPIYAADIRSYQVINPDNDGIPGNGTKILSVEIEDDPGSRAITAVRVSDEIAGTQFHPEADPESLIYHMKQPERKQQIVERFNEEKYFEMLDMLEHPDKIKLTRKTVLPNFLEDAKIKLSLNRL